MITKEEFEKLAGIKLVEEDGKLVYYGNLYLAEKNDITELPDNLKVLGWLNLRCSGVTKLPKCLEVEGLLDISETDIEELPDGTKFGKSLHANKMKKSFSFPKVVKVNGHFDCEETAIRCMPEEVYAKWCFDLSGSTFDKLPKVMEIGYSLYLDDTDITELPEGFKEVYGSIDIRSTKVSKLNENFVAYGGLNLGYTPIEDLPEGFIVGNELDLHRTYLNDYSNLHKVCSNFVVTEYKYNEIKDTLAKHSFKPYNKYYYDNNNNILVTFEPNYKGAYLFENKNGRYIKADDIFAKIIEQKGNVYHVKLSGGEDIIYLVTDGEGHWSHGMTLEKAKDDLLYKITDRDKSDYEGLSLDSELSFEDAIVCYRVITGACSLGTRDFIENRLGKNKKDKYTISDIIKITEGEYGNDVFKDFFHGK